MGSVAVVGGGPAGLMAAERVAAAGHAVTVYDRMPTLGRKLLMAGKSGLNLTKAEAPALFLRHFGATPEPLLAALAAFGPDAVRAFAAGLGIETFIGSSGRVFPRQMKASPLLRAWLTRLAGIGVEFRVRHTWTGFDGGNPVFSGPAGTVRGRHDAAVIATGGASWPRLGSDGAFLGILSSSGVDVQPLRPANMGFDVQWSAEFAERFAGIPVKPVAAGLDGTFRRGEFVVTRNGVEGSLVYALSASLRDRIEREGMALLALDLLPGRDRDSVAADLARPRGKRTLSEHLRRTVKLDGIRAALLRELASPLPSGAEPLARVIKSLPLRLVASRPLAEAISTAGGVALTAIDRHFMLRALPGIFVAGEMLDWEATTGGYLLTACLATGRAAGDGVVQWLTESHTLAPQHLE